MAESSHPPSVFPKAGLPARRWFLHPAVVTFFALGTLALLVILQAGGDPLALARLGTRYSRGDPNGSEGYDGQFVYYIALHPSPGGAAPFLDAPAYRYQRILLPLVARGLSLASPAALPWVLALLGVAAQAAGTWAVAELLAGWGVSRKFALGYGLYAGFTLAVRLDLPEPLAYGLVACALLACQRGRWKLCGVLYGLALFAKETTFLFVGAQIFADLLQRRWRQAFWTASVALVPFLFFQTWLWKEFGQPGIGSGGAMATPFEVIPFMGFLRIGMVSPVYLAAMLVVFGPAVILPALWGIWQGIKFVFNYERNVIVLSLLINALVIVFLPFSTFRETGGLLRFTGCLVLAVILFAGRYHQIRVLNYTLFWIVLNVFLVKS